MENTEDKNIVKRYEYIRNNITYTTPNITAAILRKDTEEIIAYYDNGDIRKIIIENEETNRK